MRDPWLEGWVAAAATLTGFGAGDSASAAVELLKAAGIETVDALRIATDPDGPDFEKLRLLISGGNAKEE